MLPYVSSDTRLNEEWNHEKNEKGPDSYTVGSGVKVWWRCKRRHEWKATISSRARGKGCPYCSGKKLLVGVNDLGSVNLQLAMEFDREKNKGYPDEYHAYSSKSVWWKCLKGHGWKAKVSNRQNGRGCPYCTNKRVLAGYNDLLTVAPRLACEFDLEKNEKGPEQYLGGSNSTVWWICKEGHRWCARISDRMRKKGCPYCAGQLPCEGKTDLQTVRPDLMESFDYEKNEKPATSYMPNSGKKVWWLCPKGHSYQMAIYNRSAGKSCPYCAGKAVLQGFNDLKSQDKQLALEFDSERNEFGCEEVSLYSNKKVWWRCQYGHCWQAPPARRKSGKGCPYCSHRYPVYGENDMVTTHPEIAKEYDLGKNKKPAFEYTIHSNAKVWWCCAKGHCWRALISTRARGYGCPYCSGRYPIKGLTDCATLRPYLQEEYDVERNPKPLDSYKEYSNCKVWWRCEKGHHWFAEIRKRSSGSGCPFCRESM